MSVVVGDLVDRAAAMLSTSSGGPWTPPTSVPRGRIVLDDGGDGSSAAELAQACLARDSSLDLVVGSAETTSGITVAVVVVDAGRADGDAMRPVVGRYLAEVGRVALVCNHIDTFWEWPAILRAGRDQVDPLRLCAVFAVASGVDDDPASGVDALVDWLSGESARDDAETERRAQLVGAACALRALNSDAAEVAELRRRRAMLTADRDRGRADRLAAVRAGLADCRAVGASRLQARLRAVSEEAIVRADRVVTRRDAVRVGDWLTTELEATVRSESAELVGHVDRISSVALLGIDAGADGGLRQLPCTAPSSRPLPGPGRVADDALVMMFGASTGLGVGRLVASQLADVGLVGWVSTAATVVFGLSIAFWVVRTRHQAARRVAMRSWVIDTCADARGRVEQLLVTTLNHAESQVCAAISRHYERSARNIARAVADVDSRLREHNRRAEVAAHAAALSREITRALAAE